MAHKPDPRDDPSTLSVAYEIMSPKWSMAESLLGGTEAMRDRAEMFMPRHSEETQESYERRLEVTTLFNMYTLTLDTLVGKPFSDAVKLNDDVPEQIKDLSEDIDLQGNSITTFARNWFREGMAKGLAHVLVDFPSITEEEREGRTMADDLAEGRRPYWLFIKPENIIFAAATNIAGREVLTHIRILETVIERDRFAETVKHRIRVLEPGIFQVWELRQDKDRRKKPEWVMIEEGETGIDFIPLVTYYADRLGLMLAKPPLEDLGFLNVRHWQSTSDQVSVLTVARFPMLAVAGATDQAGSVMAIGPKQLLGTKDPNGRFYYVEHSGKAIASGRQDLLDLENMMASYGAEFLKRQPGNTTATARALDSAEAMSYLQDAAIRFADALDVALQFTASWLNISAGGGTVDMRTDFGPDRATADRLKALLTARYGENGVMGDLSREDFLEQLKEMQILTDEFDPKVNLARLLMEAAMVGFDVNRIVPSDFGREKEDGPQIKDDKDE